jgi:hypothetical protein
MINLTQSPPSYLPAALAVAGRLEPGQLRQVFAFHDNDCPKLAGGTCACSPFISSGYVLYWRPQRRFPWEAVTITPTELEAWDTARTSRKGGDFYVKPNDGQKP